MADRPSRPTLADVAEAAGVSTALVSLVMRDRPGAAPETRARVLATADRLGYRPDARARLLRSGRSRLVGVVFGVQHAFHGDLLTGLYAEADRLGYELALSAMTPDRDEQRAVDGLLADRCEALVVLSLDAPAARLRALADRLPTVVLLRPVRAAGVDVVRTGDADGMRQAVDHLADLGHRRIAHVDGGATPGAAERREGYTAAMRERGLGRHVRVVAGGAMDDDGSAAAEHLLARPPTAVTVFNDRAAVGVLDRLRRAGLRVPEDVSVVGYDDSSVARLTHVALTTVAQDAATLTSAALRRAVDRVEGRSVRRRELVVPPHLVVRATTAPPSTVPASTR